MRVAKTLLAICYLVATIATAFWSTKGHTIEEKGYIAMFALFYLITAIVVLV